MPRSLLLASLALTALALVPGCKKESTTPPPEHGDAGVIPPEQEGESPTVAASTAPEPIECSRAMEFGPILVSATQYASRYAATVTKFSAVNSTKDRPAEVCGIGAGVELLVALTCDDGRNPFADRMAAHSSRAGNVGPGGRCGSIVDRYVVPCPEGTFDIYIDSYICADAAAF